MASENASGKSRVIAIDGPAASGKGTLARSLADRLGFAYLDTGKLYRAAGLAVLGEHGDPADDRSAVLAAEALRDGFTPGMLSDPGLGRDETGSAASKVSVFPGVLAALLDLQKQFAANPPQNKPGAVLDGRDIGTVVCPDADIKFFVTAAIDVRAERRYKELQSKDIDVTYEAVLAEMRRRDARDSGRAASPMKAADDAVILDTTHMHADEALQEALRIVSK
jgi:cytidylate kinase